MAKGHAQPESSLLRSNLDLSRHDVVSPQFKGSSLTTTYTKSIVVIVKVRRTNPNEPITPSIPVLLPANERIRDGRMASFSTARSFGVRVVPTRALEMFVNPQERKVFERDYGRVPEKGRKRLLYVLGLMAAIEGRDSEALRRGVEAWVANAEDPENAFWHLWYWEVRPAPLYALNRELNYGVGKARFVVWWSDRERRFVPGLWCENTLTALYALALSYVAKPGGLSVCLRCRTPFFRLRGRQRYCSYRCRVAAGMVRYRARKKRKPRKRR